MPPTVRCSGRRLLVVLAVAAAGLTAGCGADDAPTPASESLPACAQVWEEGATLPADYAGCLGEDGTLQVSNAQTCTLKEPGAPAEPRAFVTFGTNFYALSGDTIHRSAFNTPEYDELYAACFGDQW